MQLSVEIATELRLCHALLSEMDGDLLADLVAGIVHRHRIVFFPWKMHARDVHIGGLFGLLATTSSFSIARLLLFRWHLHPSHLPLLEEFPGSDEGLAS